MQQCPPNMNQNKLIPPGSEKFTFLLTKTAEPYVALFISKHFLLYFQQVDIHALGSAINIAVKCACTLKRTGIATITKIDTPSQTIEDRVEPKIIISLRVTQRGLELLKEESEIRKQI
ncbi:unnamed protein product (macronuclear) [Paramecium tetraurelia]|uniref:DNA/RNA-binding protein Alba-like domain-containing protein n=1 Tax=Paramecium tetraurelia TaxID=5888 RepID=A0E2H4_PARTE|nr:uncharacterized protein GSPATT00022663001 [Paramecium tetraurelia]CAK89491.1 unnamed protein product [Paramecium tetraurelia]|eukprot:XP_001456888.1 hypothetical protein (macronuclear) [Paramecium tetraurelia strain d4-2]